MAKVLLIEDDPLIYRMYQKTFTLEGFEVELAEDGQTGYEKAQSVKPDIILLDIMMPHTNGIEFLGKLKADPTISGIPVIVLTNISDMNIMHMATAKGAIMYIIKSRTDPSEVVASVRGVLGKDAAVAPAPVRLSATVSPVPEPAQKPAPTLPPAAQLESSEPDDDKPAESAGR